jgi:hypothetical protein
VIALVLIVVLLLVVFCPGVQMMLADLLYRPR